MMDHSLEQLVSSLDASAVSDDLIRQIATLFQEKIDQSATSAFISDNFQALLSLQNWIWQSLIGSFQSPSYPFLIQTVATLQKRLIYDYRSTLHLDSKAALIFSPSIDQMNQTFDLVDQAEHDNDPFIGLVNLLFDNFAYFLHDNPLYEKLPLIEHLNQCIISRYLMTDRYKLYLHQLRQEHPLPSIFTARFLFYIKTCSFYSYANLASKASRLSYTAEDMVRFLAEDYLTIVHTQSLNVNTWSPELIGSMAQLVGLMCGLFWWDGQKRTQMSLIFVHEKVTCRHIEDLVRIIAQKTFYQQTQTLRWNDETILMDSLLLALFLIVQTQNINWFFRANSYLQETIIDVASAALNDEIGLCGFAVLGEVLSDDQLKDLKISDNICNFFFTMLAEAWSDQSKKYKQMPIGYLLKGKSSFSVLNSCHNYHLPRFSNVGKKRLYSAKNSAPKQSSTFRRYV